MCILEGPRGPVLGASVGRNLYGWIFHEPQTHLRGPRFSPPINGGIHIDMYTLLAPIAEKVGELYYGEFPNEYSVGRIVMWVG